MIVEYKTTKGGYWFFMIKYGITRKLIENHGVLFECYMHKALSHVMFPRNFHLCGGGWVVRWC